MKTRTIKELLILLRDALPSIIGMFDCGSICWTIAEMYATPPYNLTMEEEKRLSGYIIKNKPENAGDYPDDCGSITGFWWPYGKLAPRLEFLDKLISEL